MNSTRRKAQRKSRNEPKIRQRKDRKRGLFRACPGPLHEKRRFGNRTGLRTSMKDGKGSDAEGLETRRR